MARVTSVTLGEHFNGFVGDMIQSGRYGNTSEVVRESQPMKAVTHVSNLAAVSTGL